MDVDVKINSDYILVGFAAYYLELATFSSKLPLLLNTKASATFLLMSFEAIA